MKKRNIYEIKNIKVGKYKGPTDVFFRLDSLRTTAINVCENPPKEFESIPIGDAFTTAVIIACEELSFYEACSKCHKKSIEGHCPSRCVVENQSNPSFSFKVRVLCDEDEDFTSYIAFKNNLPVAQTATTSEESKASLEKMIGQIGIIDYQKPREGDERQYCH